MIVKLSEINGAAFEDGRNMINILFLSGAPVSVVIIMLWRIISNIAEIANIRRNEARRSQQYAEDAWSFRQCLLMTLLAAEIMVALAISTLIILVLLDASF
ncbi:hypothetical protein BSU01_22585 [Erwinia billingiae]|uniref:hypothetical protein n=1 Tax=Erwinia billingiae TaxID=182337 RepID=UPI0019D0EE81|nr:hypothetical protein [Erwinia billingiae]MBN7124478.1 hypothetical protein [Erwinia billingiae]